MRSDGEEDTDSRVVEESVEPNLSTDQLHDIVLDTITAYPNGDDSLPATEDIRVVVTEERRVESGYYDDEYRPLQGGVHMQTSRWCVLGCTACTLATTVRKHGSYENRLVTAAHCVDDHEDSKMYQPGGWGTSFGRPDQIHYEPGLDDAATIDLSETDSSAVHRIADDDGGFDYYVRGTVAYDELKDHENDSSYTVYQQGRTTGRNSGSIDFVGSAPHYDLGRLALQDIEVDFGDSGGPMFVTEGSNAYIAGVLTFFPADGNLMAKIEEVFDVSVWY